MIQKTLIFTVTETAISRGDTIRPVADNQNYYRAKFTLSEDWDGLTRTALFVKAGIGYPILLDETLECDIPTECLQYQPGSVAFNVSIFGGAKTTRSHIETRNYI